MTTDELLGTVALGFRRQLGEVPQQLPGGVGAAGFHNLIDRPSSPMPSMACLTNTSNEEPAATLPNVCLTGALAVTSTTVLLSATRERKRPGYLRASSCRGSPCERSNRTGGVSPSGVCPCWGSCRRRSA